MEKALVLIKLKHKYSRNLLSQLKNIVGVADADFIFGPSDAYATIETESKENLWNIVTKIRNVYGVHNTLTCNAVA